MTWKSVLLIIGGGIAAYKSLELIRLLKGRGIGVKSIMTRAAEEFVTPLSVASLSGAKVHTDLFDLTDEIEMGHIELSRAADLLVVAPATADLMAKMAQGRADDLASTALLATDKPVLVAPAMNVRMWQHPATQRNLRTLTADGVHVVGPNDGEMACGEFGPGRMAEPSEILSAIEKLLTPGARPLAGRKVRHHRGPDARADRSRALHLQPFLGQAGLRDRRSGRRAGRRSDPGLGANCLADPAGRPDAAGRDGLRRCSRPARRNCPATLPSSRPPWPTGAWLPSRDRS